MNSQEVRQRIGGAWQQRIDRWCLTLPCERIHDVARTMRQAEARFSALVALQTSTGDIRLIWHWDLQGTLLAVETTLARYVPVPSIVDIYPGADWAERETCDYYAVTFSGRDRTPALMLRDGDAPGVLLSPGRKRA